MDRNQFIKTCGYACIGVTGLGFLLENCNSVKIIPAKIIGSDIQFPISDFEFIQNKKKKFRKYVIVQNERLQFPICIFRLKENEYSAVLMKCSHQGAELQVFGEKLQCPAHGSEFDKKGVVQNAPADANLRTFPVTADNTTLKISLK